MISLRQIVNNAVVPGQMVLVLIILLGAHELYTCIAANNKQSLASGSVSRVSESDSSTKSKLIKNLFAPQINIESIKIEAINIAERTVKELPGSDSFALLGNVHKNNGNSAEALKCWRKSLELDPKNTTALKGIVSVAMMKAEYDKVAELWQEMIKINPELPDAHLALASALACLGKTEEAIASLKKDIETNPQPGLSYAMLGNQYLLLGQYDKAKAAFMAALPYASSRCNAYYGLATVHARLGEMDKSREYTETFRKLKKEEMEALKKRDSTFDDLTLVCEHVAQTHTDLATVYLKHNRLEEAELLMQRAAELNANNVLSRQILGSIYQQTGKYAKALDMFEQLIRIEPKKTVYYFNMGICAGSLGQFDKAEQYFQKMIEIAPKQAEGYRETARFYLMINSKQNEALLLAQKAAELQNDAETFYVLSWAYESNGDIKSSLKTISHAVNLAPDNTDYRRTYERLKKQEEQNDQ